MVNKEWLKDFDQQMQKMFGMDSSVLEEEWLLQYAHLKPEDAAIAFGEDCKLTRL